MSSDPQSIREWLASLALLIGTAGGAQDAAARLNVYVAYLLNTFPIEVFSAASCQAIARTSKYMPSYAELCDKLEAWWMENRPDRPPPRLTVEPAMYRVHIPAKREPPTEAEVDYVGDIVTALRIDLQYQASARAAATPKRSNRTAYVLSDGQLLAIYEAAGPAGIVRADLLRKKIGAAALAHTRDFEIDGEAIPE